MPQLCSVLASGVCKKKTNACLHGFPTVFYCKCVLSTGQFTSLIFHFSLCYVTFRNDGPEFEIVPKLEYAFLDF